MIIFNLKVQSRRRELDGGLYVTWAPELEELGNYAWHGMTFLAGVTEQEIADYGSAIALPSVFAAIDGFFPGVYTLGGVI